MINILLPTDFSSNAWNATLYALEFFKEETCTFHLLNTYTPAIVHSRFMATTLHGEVLEDSIKSESELGLVDLLSSIKAEGVNPKHQFKTFSSFNILTDEIKNLVSSCDIDLIITGTKGASGLDEIFMGSNTVRIINSIDNCGILAIPDGFSYDPPKEITLITDFKSIVCAENIDPLRRMANKFQSAIRILHIDEEKNLDKFQETNQMVVKEYLSKFKVTDHRMPYYASKSEIIENFMEENPCQMLSMVNSKHGFLENLLKEAVIKKLAFHTQIPMLILPE
jgi:nucleotide-binding universal stress UspA family protein